MTSTETQTDDNDVRSIGGFIAQYVTNRLAVSVGDVRRKKMKVSASAVFDYINTLMPCNEQTFVKALNFIRQRYPIKYDRLDIPKKWNGGSRIAIPEAYRSSDKMLCKVKTQCSPKDVYDNVDQTRLWRPGDFVWVPRESEKVMTMIANDVLEIVDMN